MPPRTKPEPLKDSLPSVRMMKMAFSPSFRFSRRFCQVFSPRMAGPTMGELSEPYHSSMKGEPVASSPTCCGCTTSFWMAPCLTSVFQSGSGSPAFGSTYCTGLRSMGLRMPTCRATAAPEVMMTWFWATTVTVAPEMASTPITLSSGRDWPTSMLSLTERPRYCSLNFSSADSGMPSRRIGSECLSTFTPTYLPSLSIPISVTTGFPE